MLAAALLPPCAAGLPEAAPHRQLTPAPSPRRQQQAKPTPQGAGGTNQALQQTPRKTGLYSHGAAPRAGGAAPTLPEWFFRPSAAAARGWAHSSGTAILRGAARAQVHGDGAGSVWRAGSYVSASAGRRGKPVQPAAQLRCCLFPNCSRYSVQNTCLSAGHPSRAPGNTGRGQQEPRLQPKVCEQVRSGPGVSSIPGSEGSAGSSSLSRLPACPNPPFSTACPPCTSPLR